MEKTRPEADRDRLSALAALVLLAYGLARLPLLPTLGLEFPLLGLLIRIDIPSRSLMLILGTIVAVSGAEAVYRGHGQERASGLRWGWVLPGLGTYAMGDVLARLPLQAGWWAGLAAAAGLLLATVALEHRALHAGECRGLWPSLGLQGIGLLMLAAAFFDLRAGGTRAVFLFPLVVLSSGAVGGRLLRLEPNAWRGFRYAATIGVVTGEIAIGLYYTLAPPVAFALLTCLGFYWMYQIIRQIGRGPLTARFALEVSAVSAVVAGVILLA